MRSQRGQERGDALHQAIIDDALVLQRLDLVLPLLSLLMDLVLLCTDEGSLVDIRVNFDIGIVTELERVLVDSALVTVQPPDEIFNTHLL